MNFSISKAAAKQLQDVLKPNTFFRIAVDAGGCFGFQYMFSFAEEALKGDSIKKFDNLNILIDEVTVPFLENAELDFVSEMMGGRFVINNPQAESACGCKNSFSLKD